MADDLAAQQAAQLAANSLRMASCTSSDGKPLYLFGLVPLECNTGASLSLTSVSRIMQPIPTVFRGSSKRKSVDSLLENIRSGLSSVAQNSGVFFSGSMPAGTPVSSAQSFAANLAAAPSSDIGIG